MKKKESLKYVLVVALVATLLLSTYLGISINNSLQACLEKNREASGHIAQQFYISVNMATDIEYEPNVDNIEALIEGFLHEMFYAWTSLYGLRKLNPELSEYEKPLYLIDRLIYHFISSMTYTGESTVRSVFEHLLVEAGYSGNYSIPVIAFKELNQTSFQKIDELGHEVLESFAPFNAKRLDNTVNMVEELQSLLSQWIDKYS